MRIMTVTSTEGLAKRWRSLLIEGSSAKQEVDARHPLRLLFGADDFQRPLFVVMTRIQPTEPDLSSAVVETAITVRADGYYLLLLALKDHSLFDVFVQLCGDLAQRSSGARTESTALVAVYSALAEWKQLLRTQPEHLTLEELRGLVGEIWFGSHQLCRRWPIAEVFQSWGGPHGAHQDFQFHDGNLFEVKAVRPGIDWVQISSEHQLDASDRRLVLAVVTLDDAEAGSSGSLTLPALLSYVRGHLASTPRATQAFEDALSEFRDPFTHSFYSTHAFSVQGSLLHAVSEGFPRLVPEGIPEGVSDIKYHLAIESIASFVVDE